MATKERIFFVLVLFCLLSSIVIAQSENQDYSSRSFYQNSEPPGWNYDRVDWSLVPTDKIKDVPPDKLDYSKLNAAQRKQMTVAQIQRNFNNIQDLTRDVDKKRAEQAIATKYNVKTDLGNGANLRGDTLSATYGIKGKTTLSANTYRDGLLLIDNKGTITLVPSEKQNSIDIPSTDSVKVTSNGRVLNLPDGTKFSGEINYENGKAYADAKDKLNINGLEISSTSRFSTQRFNSDKVYIYFDGLSHEQLQDYISFNKDGKQLIVNMNDGFALKFNKDNPFVKIEDTDNFEIRGARHEFTSTNRDEQGLIPKLVIQSHNSPNVIKKGPVTYVLGDPIFEMTNGQVLVHANQNSVRTRLQKTDATSTPVEIQMLDAKGNNILGTKTEDRKLVISNYNELAAIPLNAEVGYTKREGNNYYAPGLISTSLYFNYNAFTEETFKEKFKDIEITGRLNPVIIKRISDSLEEMPPKIVESVRGFEILTPEEYAVKRANSNVEHALGSVGKDGIIKLSLESTESTNIKDQSLIYHEAAHTLIYSFEEESFKKNPELITKGYESLKMELNEIAKKYNVKLVDVDFYSDDIKFKIESENSAKGRANAQNYIDTATQLIERRTSEIIASGSDFLAEWLRTAGDVYGKNMRTVNQNGREVIAWTDGTLGPRNGCVTTYGCYSLHEDVATFVQPAAINPKFFESLITPGSPQYDERYRKKLDLLLKYGFLKEDVYNKIISNKK